ncbi:MAG: hypothetical protein WB676_24590 [Bryobacteraceae bacterium]
MGLPKVCQGISNLPLPASITAMMALVICSYTSAFELVGGIERFSWVLAAPVG